MMLGLGLGLGLDCRMDFKDFARRSTASNVYIFFYESLSKVPLVFALS